MSSTDQVGDRAIDLTDDSAASVVDLRDSTLAASPGGPGIGEGEVADPGLTAKPAVGAERREPKGGGDEADVIAADARPEGPDADAAAGGDEPPEDLLAGIELAAALESLLIIAAEPMSAADLAVATGVPEPEVGAALQALADQYQEQGRGFELRSVAGAWRFYSAAQCAPVVHRWVTDGRQSRLSQAALETLAVVAYQQPVSRAKVGAIRGVNVDGVMRTLHARGLVAETGADPHTGATLYGTTDYFLERMGLADLADLPPIGDLLPDPSDVTDHIDGEGLDLP